jgi:hypothetical protein
MLRYIIPGFALILAVSATAGEPEPKIKIKGNTGYFYRMPRAWVEILKIDSARRMLTVRKKSGEEVEVAIRPDTNLMQAGGEGNLDDFYPSESVMLFMYHDDMKKWVYPRAVQAEMQMLLSHNHWWKVEALDIKAGTIALTRTEKDKSSREEFRIGPATKVYKSDMPAGAETLAVGDVVLYQTRYEKGQEKRFADMIVNAKGLETLKTLQQAKQRTRLAEEGWQAIVNDVDRLKGAVYVTVQGSGARAAKEVKTGTWLELKSDKTRFVVPAVDSRPDGHRQKIILVADPVLTVRLEVGEIVRIAPAPAAKEAAPNPK